MEQYANDATTTLSGAITSGATSLVVASAMGFPSGGPFRIRIDSEILRVTAVAGTTWTVERGRESTSPASHATGVAVEHVLTAASLLLVVQPHEAASDPHPGYQRESERGSANGYAGLDAEAQVPTAQLGSGTADGTTFLRGDQTWATPPGGGGGTAMPQSTQAGLGFVTRGTLTEVTDGVHRGPWMMSHEWTDLLNGRSYGRYFGVKMDGATDNTAAIQTAMNAFRDYVVPGMKRQAADGTFQGGADAPGAGMLEMGPGVSLSGPIIMEHRVVISGVGYGTVLRALPGLPAGAFISNYRGADRVAQQCQLLNLQIDGNRYSQTNAVHGIVFTGDATNNYQDTRAEDYDEHHRILNVKMIHVSGDGVRFVGAGENHMTDVAIRSVAGIGVYTDQDNWFTGVSTGHTGRMGFHIQGDGCRLTTCKAWYAGRVVSADGYGYYLTADTGVMSASDAQDNTMAGLMFENAHGWHVQAVADSNDTAATGAPGFDFWNSSDNALVGTARNRYKADGTAGVQDTALRHRGGSTDNTIDIRAANDVWGTVTNWSADSIKNNSVIRVNAAVMM